MNVLYLTYDGLTDPLGQSQVIPYLKGLSAKGWEITILSLEKSEKLLKVKSDIENQLKEAGISWQYNTYLKNPPVLAPFINHLLLRRKALSLQKKYSFNIVHCRSYLPGLIGLKMKKVFGAKFIFDMRGFWADERVEGGIWNLKNPFFNTIYKYFKKREKDLVWGADHIVVLTNKAKEIVLRWNASVKIEVIPCCADMDHFSPDKILQKDVAGFKNELKIDDDDFVISYLGSVSTWYLLDEMLDFFKIFLKAQPKAKFLFISNESKNFILRRVEEKNIPLDCVRIKSAARSEVPSLLNLSKINLFFIKPVFSKQGSSATKMAEVLAVGIPIICNTGVGDIDYFMKEGSIGWMVRSFDESEYRKVSADVLRSAGMLDAGLRAFAREHFSLEEGVRRYNNIYNQLIN